MASKTEKLKLKILDQLRLFPNVQLACERIGIGRSTYYDWRKNDTKFKEATDKAVEFGNWFINDLAESKLIQNIKDGDNTAIIFWLKKHHPRYYDEVAHKHKHTHEIVIDKEPIDPETAKLIRRTIGLFKLKKEKLEKEGSKSWDSRDEKKPAA